MPCRVSAAGARGIQRPVAEPGGRLGNHGTGASTMAGGLAAGHRWRSRFSTKMPWFGRAALGNSVEKVSRPDAAAIAIRVRAWLGCIRCLSPGRPAASAPGLLLEVGLIGDDGFQLLPRLVLVAGVFQRDRVVIQDARIASASPLAWRSSATPLLALPLVVRIQPSVSAVCGLGRQDIGLPCQRLRLRVVALLLVDPGQVVQRHRIMRLLLQQQFQILRGIVAACRWQC